VKLEDLINHIHRLSTITFTCRGKAVNIVTHADFIFELIRVDNLYIDYSI